MIYHILGGVIDNVTSTSKTDSLSANQGRVLNASIQSVKTSLDTTNRNLTNLQNNLSTTNGNLTNLTNQVNSFLNGKVKLRTDGEGGNVQIISPNGSYWEMDSYDSSNFRIFHHNGSKYDAFYTFNPDTNGNVVVDGELNSELNNRDLFLTFEEQNASTYKDLMNIDTNNKYGWANRNLSIYHKAGDPINGSPISYTEEFLVYRQVWFHSSNCIVVTLFEAYPQFGRRWGARYDTRAGWVQTWKQI